MAINDFTEKCERKRKKVRYKNTVLKKNKELNNIV